MAQAEENISRKPQQISMQVSKFPRDLFQKFISENQFTHKFEEPSEFTEEEIELSLGLSLNGRFGVDPLRPNKLIRSSSIPDFVNPVRDKDTACVVPMACAPLIRTCSLPTETEEEWGKRKELQTLRRMEAKRKRFEKQRNSKVVRERSQGSIEEDKRVEIGNGGCQKDVKVLNDFSCSVAAPPFRCGSGGRGDCGGSLEGVTPPPPLSQGSIGSQGTGSSGISESESQPAQGMNKCTEARSPTSVQSLPESEQKPPVNPGMLITGKSGKCAAVGMENLYIKPTIADKGAKEIARNVLEDMPCVSTKGDGPNGKRIEGFLYRYRKGEEVRIVCVCHGSFLTPAEFVKHAGGGDVAHPLKHIVVNPTPFL